MDNLVASYMKDDGEHDAEITRTTLEMQSANRSILELIQQLGPYLTSKEVAARIKACTFLGRILSNLPDSYLSTKELSHIAEFLCARLQDHYTLQPSVLTCLQKISSSVNLDKNNAEYIIDSMFKEIHTQSCLQSDRYKVFQILSSIFDNHKSMIISKGRDFIYNYVQAIDGEQDPRNLLVIFQLSSDLVREGIHLGSMVEEFFEVASCYFPIDFDPSAAGKKSTITNQDLVAGLRRVIASSEEFAKYWIPLCLEKMESDIESAKLDAILTLIECLPLYSKSSLESFLSSIWSRLRQEITHVVSQDVEKNALNLLTELVRTLSQWPLDSSSKAITDLQSFLSEVLNDCLPRLEEPIQDKFTWMSGLMLLACAKGSPKGCSQITTAVIALLVKRAKKLQMEDLSSTASVPLPLMPSGIHSIIEYMVKIMSVCSSFSFEVDQNPLAPFYKDIMIIFISVLSEKRSVSAKCIAVAGIASLLSFNLLKREDLVEIADCFFSFFTGDVDLKLSKEILSASGYFASKYPHVVKSHLLPRVFTVVSENDLISEPIKSVKKTFTVLCALSTHFNTLQEVVSYVIDLVKKCKIDDQNSEFLAECLDCMLQITKISTLSQESMEYLSLHVVLPLIRKSIEASMQLTVPGQCCTRCDSIEDVSVDCVSLPFVKTAAVIVRNICQKQKSGKTADSIVETISGLYLNKNVAAFGITLSDVSINFEPFSSDFSPVQTRTVCFVTSSICSFDVTVQVPRAEEFMNQLLDLALQSTDQPTYVSAAKSFAGLLNKHHKTDEIVEKVRCALIRSLLYTFYSCPPNLHSFITFVAISALLLHSRDVHSACCFDPLETLLTVRELVKSSSRYKLNINKA